MGTGGSLTPGGGGGGGGAGSGGGSASRWREACEDPDSGQLAALRGDVERKRSEAQAISREIENLRERLAHERAETAAALEGQQRDISSLEKENLRLQGRLDATRVRDSAKESEASGLKKEVEEKTQAIERGIREMQQQQQVALSRIKDLANSMLTSCAASPGDVSGLANRSTFGSGGSGSRGGPGSHGGPGSVVSAASKRRVGAEVSVDAAGRSGGRPPQHRGLAAAAAAGSQDDGQAWFQSVRENLQQFGDVDVFIDSSARDCACCLELMSTPYRIRPRKCSHVFHVECLLQSWTEGTCPVCGVSFAPDASPPGGEM